MNREAIFSALFDRVQALPGVVTTSRVLKHWADVPAEQQPAVYQAQGDQQPQTRTGEPTKWLLGVKLHVYVRTGGGRVPAAVMNPILDAIEALFPQHPVTGKNTLDAPGVEWARIDGAIETDEGTLGDQAVAVVPIQILAT